VGLLVQEAVSVTLPVVDGLGLLALNVHVGV
jgi:hypothetical protein